MVDVGRPAAVNGVADGGVFRQLVLQVHDRFRASDEQDGVAVVQPPYLIWGQQFTATLSSGEFKKVTILSLVARSPLRKENEYLDIYVQSNTMYTF